ncbi:MAG: tol-pal system protein YbgF [Rhodomicrobium sp.]
MRSIAAALISLAISAALFPAAAQMPGSRAPSDGGSAQAARLERLEEQIQNLQGVVAAVETLAKNNAGAGSGYSAAAGGGASSEQIRQLSEQIADLTQRLERLEAQMGGGSVRPQAQQAPRQDMGYAAAPAGGFEDKQQLPPLGAPQAPAERYAPRPQQSASAGLPPASTQSWAYGQESGGAPTRSNQQAAPVTASAGGSARALFDQAYGALNRREYSAAETYFQQFLDQYPADPLAGSAQYWLGETAFVSGEYKSAADRFLKTFTNYPTNERAPEALLKLAISLRRLGNNTDACATFAELGRRYPQAPKSVLQRADAEKKRANCS